MNEKLNDALQEISDAHVAEASAPKKRRNLYWLGAIAAVLAVVLVIHAFTGPMLIQAEAMALADDPRIATRPNADDYETGDEWRAALDAWQQDIRQRQELTASVLPQLSHFFTEGSAKFLSGSHGNLIWSPANAYIGLAALTEITGGNTRQQILSLLGVQDLAALRSQVSAVWESVYTDNGNEICTLANSLWLDDTLDCHKEALTSLSHHYYASVYRGDLGSSTMNKAIGAWLNNNTGGLLRNAADNIRLPQDTLLVLYSTLYFQSKWADEFNAAQNTDGIFHAPSGDREVTFMNREQAPMAYYWGDCFSAVSLGLKNGSRMWFILPDEGKTPEDVLTDGEYMETILTGTSNRKEMKVNLSVPKFDVSGTQNLMGGLQQMGLTDLFDPFAADFSSLTGNGIFLTAANQSVRVQIDEKGVKAAAYIEFPGAGMVAPPEEIIDFVLDRPFLFVITNDSVPLFAGTVKEP